FPRKTDCATTAPMPTARPWRRGQAPQPRSGAPKAPGLTAAITVAAPSSRPSIVPDDSTRADTPIKAFATSRIYTSLTDTTRSINVATLPAVFMALPPIADRDAAPLLPSTPGRPRDTSRCRVHRRGRGRWRAPEVAARRSYL